VPSRRNCRKVATMRTPAVGRRLRPLRPVSGAPSQHAITVAMRSKILPSKFHPHVRATPVNMGIGAAGRRMADQPRVFMATTSYGAESPLILFHSGVHGTEPCSATGEGFCMDRRRDFVHYRIG
jgi:hypothetical protein